MTSGPLPVSPTTNSTLIWDGENRLTEVKNSTGTIIEKNVFDSGSRKIATTANGITTLYLYDGWNCIAEYTRSVGVSPTLQKTRLWGTDLSGFMQGAGGVGGMLSESSPITSNPITFNSSYPTYDGNGNVSEYLSANGTIAAHFEYDPFGNTVVNTDTGNLFAYRFSTKPRDTETGLYYYGYRYYDPLTGRWPSRDPIGERGGVNLYAFVGNNPINHLDYLGCLLDYYGHWFLRSGTDLTESFSTFDKGWKVDDFPDYAKAKADVCTKKSRVPINTTIQVNFGATSIGVGDVRLIGAINYNSITKKWSFLGGHISIDDNFYDFNKAKRSLGAELLTRIGGLPPGKDYWVRIHGKRDVTDSGCCP
jgi:RHS repeat-associated protein